MTRYTELQLFEDAPGLVRGDAALTSAEAARLLGASGTLRRRVFNCISRDEHGVTDLDIQERLGIDGNTERPRRVELVRAGVVEDSGLRANQNGRDAIVWRVKR